LIPVTIDSSTCSGVAVDMLSSFGYTVVSHGSAEDTDGRAVCQY
jgi:hypothetical protein